MSECPMTPAGRSECAQLLIDTAAADGTDITASATPPSVIRPYTDRWRCPHSAWYWTEPTGEQIAAWIEAEVP